MTLKAVQMVNVTLGKVDGGLRFTLIVRMVGVTRGDNWLLYNGEGLVVGRRAFGVSRSSHA